MADGINAQGDAPQPPYGDDEVGESTVATEAPRFDSQAPPFDSPNPPPVTPLPPAPRRGGLQLPPTAPVAFTAGGASRAALQIQRKPAPTAPLVATPLGGFAPSKAEPGAPDRPPSRARPDAAAPRAPGAPPPRPAHRQTTIGLAPQAGGPPRPGKPAPAPPGKPPSSPSAGRALAKGDAQGFGLDAAVADAARAAVGSSAPRHSPLATTGYSSDSVTSERELPRSFPASASPPDAVPSLYENESEYESTRSVPREVLLANEPQVVIGSAAGGDEATLAVSPEQSGVSAEMRAALARTLQQESVGFPSPGAPRATAPAFTAGAPMSDPRDARLAASPWSGPQQPPILGPSTIQGLGAPPPPPAPPMGLYPGQGPPVHALSEHGPMAPGMHPGQGFGPPPPYAPMSVRAPNSYPGYTTGPLGSPPQAGVAPSSPWSKPTRMILLLVIIVVSLAIFVTGVVLFLTRA